MIIFVSSKQGWIFKEEGMDQLNITMLQTTPELTGLK